MGNSLWYKNAVFYEVYVRGFKDSSNDGNGDLIGLIEKTDYLQELGIDCLWLLPIYPSPLIDDGYDISDYYSVLPDYGTLEDFKALLDATHKRGMRLITDLVLNHTSDQHWWFQAARVNRNSPYRDYYVWSDTDQKYQDARIIFLDTEKSNWTWDEAAGQYFWHRFYSSQPDLNYDNPAVQDEMLSVIEFWLELGIDGFRVDAVAYMFKRGG
ncbi:MAG TPA: alpha-amylase family glycosyl hydrolase, partial [Anaerolineales bacterium]|nr:alpha-amylase family glycosyl hydrolase [Anaerolineales bacterium]